MLVPILTFIAFLLLLLVSLSVPIIKSIYLFRLSAHLRSTILRSNATGTVDFGTWGYCTSPIDVSVVGIDHKTAGNCSHPHLGYTIDDTVANLLHASGLQNTLSRTSTAALVLHPIATGLVFLTVIISLSFIRRGSSESFKFPSLLTLGTGLLAATITTIVFLVDVIVVAVVRHRVNDTFHGDLVLDWGNAVWMALGATIALWLATAAACASVCAYRRKHRANKY